MAWLHGNTSAVVCPYREYRAMQYRGEDYERTAIAVTSLKVILGPPIITINGALLISLIRVPNLRTPPNLLLCNVLLADLLVGLVVIPMGIPWVLNYGITRSCSYHGAAAAVGLSLAGVSFLSIQAICIERYLALFLHLQYALYVTLRSTKIVVAAIWLYVICITAVCNSPLAYHFANISLYYISAHLLVGIVVIYWTYSRIFRLVLRHRKQIDTISGARAGSVGRKESAKHSKRNNMEIPNANIEHVQNIARESNGYSHAKATPERGGSPARRASCGIDNNSMRVKVLRAEDSRASSGIDNINPMRVEVLQAEDSRASCGIDMINPMQVPSSGIDNINPMRVETLRAEDSRASCGIENISPMRLEVLRDTRDSPDVHSRVTSSIEVEASRLEDADNRNAQGKTKLSRTRRGYFSHARVLRQSKFAVTMAYVTGVTLLCYAPVAVTFCAIKLTDYDKSAIQVSLVSFTVGISSSLWNPLIYCRRNTEIRSAVCRLLCMRRDDIMVQVIH
ncbi:predicted protein [Nematostella vectensis]|uniref:G-protein coupled receptors family 1 profile domain-containing protein n=1 Tax=Nematostella vectensis TaxID=45351 RepID=A7SZT9_NEMVE|nr:predicted protein [Nematostella vectensis]|eukprot:XP_001622882.1 predicted protein [Nematostella vectensis]